MKDKITDLIYAARSVCEALRDRIDIMDDEELKEHLEELEIALYDMGEIEDENSE